MGYVFAEVTLKNSRDTTNAVRGDIKESEIRQKTVQALVDTGCFTLVITEEIRRELGLEIKGKKGISLADNTRIICQYTEPVDIHWKDRDTALPAMVVPERKNVLLGALPLQYMDLIVDPKHEEVIGGHGDDWVCYI